jgi:hypothetical protein
MTALLTRGFAMSALAISVALSADAASQNPAQGQELFKIFDDHDEAAPSTLVAWKKVEIVLHRQVVTPVVREPGPGVPPGEPATEYRIAVLEVFKGAELVGAAKELLVHHRSQDPFSDAPRAQGAPVLETGNEYVLFLRNTRWNDALPLSWGLGCLYRIRDGLADVPFASRAMWKSRKVVSRQELLTVLRAMRARPGK